MMLRGSMTRPNFGFAPMTITSSVTASFGLDVDRGILVLNLDSLKPVGMSGLQTGDVITALDQHQIYNMGGFWHSVLREGEPTTIQTTVQGRSGQLPLSLQRPPLQTVN
jgi:S1-C subfamily serine protease